MKKRTILILYHMRGVYPLRDTIKSHLLCWKRYSTHNTVYVNVAYAYSAKDLTKLNPDVILLHTSFCALRWKSPSVLTSSDILKYLTGSPAYKIAMPQDEFLMTQQLSAFFKAINLNLLLTCADEKDYRIIYASLLDMPIEFETVLTGYLDTKTIKRIKPKLKPIADRPKGVGYRAWRAAYWLGRHGQLKVKIADETLKAANDLGIDTDISLEEKDTIKGLGWLTFLSNCRATIGVEGGASVLDHDGHLQKEVERFLAENPHASFAETEHQCFPGRDEKITLACISPRHLEAAMTKTAQILVEGHYNGVLKPNRHYLPLKKDLSNIKDVLVLLKDTKALQSMADRAYVDIVAGDQFRYETLVASMDMRVDSNALFLSARGTSGLGTVKLNLKDRLQWLFTRVELDYVKRPGRYKLARYIWRLRRKTPRA